MALHFDYASSIATTSSKRPTATATRGSSYTAPLTLRFLYSFHDPSLKSLLCDYVEKFKERLILAVNKGSLETAVIMRDFDERLISKETYVHYDDLMHWLSGRGYTCGDIFGDWVDGQTEVLIHACDEIAYLQATIKSGNKIPFNYPLLPAEVDKIAKSDHRKLLLAYKAIVIENQRLKEQQETLELNQPSKVDRPVSTRQRRTLLTIIAALCNQAGINHQARGASQRIKEITETLGAPVDDGTIAKLLEEIPDALEVRMK